MTSLSRMNKPELYAKCQELVVETFQQKLFIDSLECDAAGLESLGKKLAYENMLLRDTIADQKDNTEKLEEDCSDLMEKLSLKCQENEELKEQNKKQQEEIEYFEEARDSACGLNACVEDSITNQLDNLNEAGNTEFGSIEELYDAWHKSNEMVKAQDEQILTTQMKSESEDLQRGDYTFNASESESESEEEENEDEKQFKCKKCCRQFFTNAIEYKCSEGECLECQKYS